MTSSQTALLFFLKSAAELIDVIPCPCVIKGPLDMHHNNCWKPRLQVTQVLAEEAFGVRPVGE